jgi:hypothetical protein
MPAIITFCQGRRQGQSDIRAFDSFQSATFTSSHVEATVESAREVNSGNSPRAGSLNRDRRTSISYLSAIIDRTKQKRAERETNVEKAISTYLENQYSSLRKATDTFKAPFSPVQVRINR